MKKHLWHGLLNPTTCWGHALPLAGILLLNIVIAFPLFLPGYTQNTWSIEPSYMASAKLISQAFPWPEWDLRWWGGYPFRLFYTPLLPYAVALLHLCSISLPTAYRLITSILFILTPLTLYGLAYAVTRRHLTAVLGATIFSVTSPVAMLIPPFFGMCRSYGMVTWRLIVLGYWGEGPHTCGLALTPLAALLFLGYLRGPTFKRLVLCAILISLIALTNLTATVGLIIILGGMWISELAFGRPALNLASGVLLAAAVLGLSAFWYNPDFVRVMFGVGQGSDSIKGWGRFWWLWLPLGGGLTALLLRFRRKEDARPMLLFLVPCVLLGILPLIHFVYLVDLMPQAHRYVPESDMMASLVIAVILTWGYDRVSANRKARVVMIVGGVVCAVGLAALGPRILARQHQHFYPVPEFRGFEIRAAEWFNQNVRRHERVFVSGNAGFWLNMFSEVQQVRGGLANSIHRWVDTFHYLWTEGDDLRLALLWSKAFNVRYVLVNYPESADPWNAFRRTERFDGKLEPVHAFEGNRIFEISLPSYGLATVVDGNALANVPATIQDPNIGGGIEDYVRMVENGREIRYWLGPRNTFHMDAEVGGNELVLVKTTYDRGWRASCQGKQLPVRPDPIGFILIQTLSPGRWEIVLEHGRVWEEWFGYGLTTLTLAGLGGYCYRRRKGEGTSPHNWLGKMRQNGNKGGIHKGTDSADV